MHSIMMLMLPSLEERKKTMAPSPPSFVFSAIRCEDVSELRSDLDANEELPMFNDIINYERTSCGCVMCGQITTIPTQNKQVCRDCDSSFWYLQEYDVVVKFCKGCKNFTCLASFTDKPLASKCFKCRQRGKNSYLAKKGNIVTASSSFVDDDGTSDVADDSLFLRSEAMEVGTNSMSGTSLYTPATVVTASTLPTTSSTRKSTAAFSSGTLKRPRLNSFVDADLSRSDGSTDCSTSSSSTVRSNRYISPPSSDSDGSIFEFSESRIHGSLMQAPSSAQPLPINHDKKPRIHVQFQSTDDEVVPAPVTLNTFTAAGPVSSSPSNLQDRWQWSLDPQANPLNFLVLATQAMASPHRLVVPPSHISSANTAATAPSAIIQSSATSTTAVSSAITSSRAAAVPVGEDSPKENKLLAVASAGLAALATLCCDNHKGDNKENGGISLAVTMALPLPDAAVDELELWVKKWSNELCSLPRSSSDSPHTL